jgi:hypothetical protein
MLKEELKIKIKNDLKKNQNQIMLTFETHDPNHKFRTYFKESRL